MDDSLCIADATELAARLRTREISSRELLDAFASRIDRLDGPVNAVCTLALEQAAEQAVAADAAMARGAVLGPLHGLPVTIKDAIATAGIRSTGGAVVLADHVPAIDAPAVAALKQAGAIVFGKTNLPEWSGKLQSYNDLFGTTNNPWDLTRSPGGSSGGAAAAVSMGFTSFELGTDLGGSVRVPAAYCGVFGHKPSFGLISTLGYVDSAEGGSVEEVDINTFGPIARSARDLDLLVRLLAGPGDERRAAWRVELPDAGIADLTGLRVAAWLGDPVLPCDDELTGAHHAVLDALRADGAFVDESARPELDLTTAWRLGSQLLSMSTYVSLSEADIAAARSGSQQSDMPNLAERLDYPMRRWLHDVRDRARIREVWRRFFEDIDVLICPVSGRTALPHDAPGASFGSMTIAVNGVERPFVEMIGWTGLIGSAYLPSTSVPVGVTAAGHPVGVQVVAPFLHDRRAIAVAARLAELTRGYVPPPAAR